MVLLFVAVPASTTSPAFDIATSSHVRSIFAPITAEETKRLVAKTMKIILEEQISISPILASATPTLTTTATTTNTSAASASSISSSSTTTIKEDTLPTSRKAGEFLQSLVSKKQQSVVEKPPEESIQQGCFHLPNEDSDSNKLVVVWQRYPSSYLILIVDALKDNIALARHTLIVLGTCLPKLYKSAEYSVEFAQNPGILIEATQCLIPAGHLVCLSSIEAQRMLSL